MYGKREHEHELRRRRRCEQRVIALCVASLACILLASNLTGCRPPAPHPDDLFQSIYADYLHGNLDSARARAQQAQKDFAASRSENDSTWALKFRLLEAEILLTQGHHTAEALALLNGSGIPVPTEGDPAIKWNLLSGLAHSRLDQQEGSRRALRVAHQLAESTHSDLIAEVLRTEGLAARHVGHVADADKLFKSSVAIGAERDILLKADNLVDLGVDSLRAGRYAEAIDWSQRAVVASKTIQAHRPLEMALGNAGWAYQNLGDFNNALIHFQEAEKQAQAIGLADHRLVWLQDAGLAEYRLSNLEKAREYDEEALRIASKFPAGTATDEKINIEANLALLLYRQSQYGPAKRLSDASVVAARNSTDSTVIAYSWFVQGLLASHTATFEEADHVLMSAWKLSQDSDLRAEIENAIANLYSGEQLAEDAELWYRRAVQTFEGKRSSVGDMGLRLSAFSYGQSVYRDYADFLIRTRRSTEALDLLDRSRSRSLEEGLGFAGTEPLDSARTSVDPQSVARNLQASLLFYSLGSRQSYLWVITANDTQLFTLPSASEIQSLLEKHQADIQQANDPVHNPNSAATLLYEVLIKPAAQMIATSSRVFIVPDGVLHRLNFETLVIPSTDTPRYWIDDVTVSTGSSIRILARLKAEKPLISGKDLLLIGDALAPRQAFTPIPDAASEIQRVQHHFHADGEVVLAKAEAVPGAYAASIPDRFRYIHFAAHATANRLSPLDSAIVLSPPQKEPEDYKLYARDIVRYPLHATLVTISACYGSGARTYPGEGLVGLAWVFLRAGAHNVIAALWQLADAASPLLMDQLYSELESGKTPDAALRAAKLSIIHSNSIYRKPIFWGALQLYAGA